MVFLWCPAAACRATRGRFPILEAKEASGCPYHPARGTGTIRAPMRSHHLTLLLLGPGLVLAGCAAAGPSRSSTTPFGGKPHPIPGTIEAEAFDEGPSGVAY